MISSAKLENFKYYPFHRSPPRLIPKRTKQKLEQYVARINTKRSSSEVSPAPSNESDIDIDIKPDLTSPSKKSKKTPSPVKSKTKPKPKSPTKMKKEGDPQNGEWDKEKRDVFMGLIIAAGYNAVNHDEVAASLGMGKKQLINQLTPGRKGSFREKAVLAVSGA